MPNLEQHSLTRYRDFYVLLGKGPRSGLWIAAAKRAPWRSIDPATEPDVISWPGIHRDRRVALHKLTKELDGVAAPGPRVVWEDYRTEDEANKRK